MVLLQCIKDSGKNHLEEGWRPSQEITGVIIKLQVVPVDMPV